MGAREVYVGHDHIVGGDAVRRDEEEGLVVDFVQVADLAPGDEREGALEVGVGDGDGVGHGGGEQLSERGVREEERRKARIVVIIDKTFLLAAG